jgi:hypothetical protein
MNKMDSKLYARHGDVFIFKLKKSVQSNNFKKQDELILALGEVTGHSHRVKSKEQGDILLFEDDSKINDSTLFEIINESVLTHEEHEPITLSPGQYLSIIQTEYDPIEHRRKVID